MAGEARFFGRRYILTISSPGGGKSYVFQTKSGEPAMDIKFDVNYARGQTARDGTVSVLGLGWEKIHDIIALSAECRGKAMSQLVRVRLEAGYYTAANMVEIFDGYAYYATVTSPPQMWLNMKVCEYNPLGARELNLATINGNSIQNLAQNVLDKFSIEPEEEGGGGEGVEFEVVDKTEDQNIDEPKSCRVSFPKSVTLKGAIDFMNLSLSDSVQFTLRTHSKEDGTRILEALDKKDNKVCPAEPTLVDGNHGLLSVTGIDAVNGCITTFLDSRFPDELTHLELSSTLNPQADGTYYIIKKQYVGHYMGPEWYVRYFCSDRKKGDE